MNGRDLDYRYRVCGLYVLSDIVLPYDPLPDDSVPCEWDVTIRLSTIPQTHLAGNGDRVTRTSLWQACYGTFLIHVESVARFLVTSGRNVLIERLGDDDDIACFTNSMFAILLQQRSVTTLHSAAVAAADGAVLLLGPSGIGKSSLAAALVERGYPLLADEVTGVVVDAGGNPVAWPELMRLRLWADVLNKMSWQEKALTPVRRGLKKFWVKAQQTCTSPLPVRAAFVLKESHLYPDIDIEPLPPGSVFGALWQHTHYKLAMDAMGQRPEHFHTVTMMAQRVPTALVTRLPEPPLQLDMLADRVTEHLCETGGGLTGSVGRAGGEEGASETIGSAGRNGDARRPRRYGPDRHREGRIPDSAGTAPASGPGIVWIAAWPKSGTTWLRAVLTSYLQEESGEPMSINALIGEPLNRRDAFTEYLGLDSSDMTNEEVVRYLPRFRMVLAERLFANRLLSEQRRCRHEPDFVKTHEVYREPGCTPRFPLTGCAGVVYLVRNPLDVAISYAHHLNWSIDRTIALMNNPEAHETRRPDGIFPRLPEPLTTWSNHVTSWTQQKDLPLHVARYEDLLADPHTGFGAIVCFAGLKLDGIRLDRAVEHSSFRRLQAQEAEFGFSEMQPTAPSFFRAGMAGSWRNALTPAQIRALVDAHGKVMERFGYLEAV